MVSAIVLCELTRDAIQGKLPIGDPIRVTSNQATKKARVTHVLVKCVVAENDVAVTLLRSGTLIDVIAPPKLMMDTSRF
jgi:hypothetical protein